MTKKSVKEMVEDVFAALPDSAERLRAAEAEIRSGKSPDGATRIPRSKPKSRARKRLDVGPRRLGYREYRTSPRARGDATYATIQQADEILSRYWDDGNGYALTVRQVYYQMVVANFIPNNEKAYKRLKAVLTDARYEGFISWDMVIDRTRTVYQYATFDDEAAAIDKIASAFESDMWADQPCRIECWIEKDAAIGTIMDVCEKLQVPLVSTRGYDSASGIKRAAERLGEQLQHQDVYILHIADHDPSGWDMTRDIEQRLEEMLLVDLGGDGMNLEINRIALNMKQVHEVLPRDKRTGKPLSQDIKMSDSRSKAYDLKFGRKCWELDALPPEYLQRIIRDPVEKIRDGSRWRAALKRAEEARWNLAAVRDAWPDALAAGQRRARAWGVR